MPRINITKVDRPLCEDCGESISDSVHCEIETATGKKLKLHQTCAIKLAGDILMRCGEEVSLLRYAIDEVEKVSKYLERKSEETWDK